MDLCVALKRLVEADGEKPTDVTHTPAFRAWFGNSKVVDAQGKPLVVYHVTNETFNEFDMSKSTGVAGAGAYFSSGVADSRYGTKTIAAYLSLKNPIDLRGGDGVIFAAQKKFVGEDMTQASSMTKIRQISVWFRDKLQDSGFDGALMDSENGKGIYFIVFSPNQIKSVDNKGTFSKSSNDIYESLDIKLKRLVERDGTIRLYRGLTKTFDAKHDLSQTDAPNGYSTWTDNPKLARAYAGDAGHVYYIDLPIDQQGDELINADGERVLFVDNKKKAGLHGVSGREYLVYTHHDLYDQASIGELT